MAVRLKYGQLAPAGLEKMQALEHYLNADTGLDQALLSLIRLQASLMNGCEFCIRHHQSELNKLGAPEAKIADVLAWQQSTAYTTRERAALGWADALTNIQDGHAPDAVYDAVRAEFSEVDTVNLTLAITTINAWNRLSIALGSHSSRT